MPRHSLAVQERRDIPGPGGVSKWVLGVSLLCWTWVLVMWAMALL